MIPFAFFSINTINTNIGWCVPDLVWFVCLHLVVFDEAGDLFASIVKFCDGTNFSLHLSIATVASSTEIIIVGR